MNTTSNFRRNARRGAAALVIGGAAAAALSTPAQADVWDQLAQCESGGNWSINTGNPFSGGLQFLPSTWAAYGGQGAAHNASVAEQKAVAYKVWQGQGWGAWPACSAKLGLYGTTPPSGGFGSVAPQAAAPVQPVAPAPQPVAAPAPQAQYQAPVAAAGQYTVKAGDTLSTIAVAHGVTWKQLFDANSGTVANPNLIFPGQVLEIPAA